MNDYSDIKIGKMIHQMKIHQSDENDGITLFLGAGCSLASSPHDISTYGIVKTLWKLSLKIFLECLIPGMNYIKHS